MARHGIGDRASKRKMRERPSSIILDDEERSIATLGNVRFHEGTITKEALRHPKALVPLSEMRP